MNPITIILILSIALVLETIAIGLILYANSNENTKMLALIKDNDYIKDLLTRKDAYIKTLQDAELKIKEDIKHIKEQHSFVLKEQTRLNNESEQSLKDIINEHDNEMRAQREKFDKLLATLFEKKDVITYVEEAFKAGNNGFGTTKDYIKDFKANL